MCFNVVISFVYIVHFFLFFRAVNINALIYAINATKCFYVVNVTMFTYGLVSIPEVDHILSHFVSQNLFSVSYDSLGLTLPRVELRQIVFFAGSRAHAIAVELWEPSDMTVLRAFKAASDGAQCRALEGKK